MRRYAPTKRARRTHSAQPALDWLQHDRHGSSVLDTAMRYIEAEKIIADTLQSALGQQCKVAKIEGQQMRLAVPSPAHAARARQLGPSVLAALNAAGWNLDTLSVQVQAALYRPPVQKKPRAIVPIDEQALHAFQELHDNLGDTPLKQAVQKLLQRHRQK